MSALPTPTTSLPPPVTFTPTRPGAVATGEPEPTPTTTTTTTTTGRPTGGTVNQPPRTSSSPSSSGSFFSDNKFLIIGIGGGVVLILAIIVATVLRTRRKRARTNKLIQKTLEEAEKARVQELNRRGNGGGGGGPSPSPSGGRYPAPPLSRGGSQLAQGSAGPFRAPSSASSFASKPTLQPSSYPRPGVDPYYQNAAPPVLNYGAAPLPPTSQSSRFPPPPAPTQGYPRSSGDRFGGGGGVPVSSPPPAAYYAPDDPPYDQYDDGEYVEYDRQGNEYNQNYDDNNAYDMDPYRGGDYVVDENAGPPQAGASTTVYLDPPKKMYAQ